MAEEARCSKSSKSVTFAGLEHRFPYPVAKPPRKTKSAREVQPTAPRGTNELNSAIRFGRRRRPGIVISMTSSEFDGSSDSDSEMAYLTPAKEDVVVSWSKPMIGVSKQSLFAIVYTSTMLGDESRALALVQDIVKHEAVPCNKKLRLSGFLLYKPQTREVLQVLEGPKSTLFALFQKIRDDPRHESVVVESSGHVLMRQFSGWQMNLIVGETSEVMCSLQYEAEIGPTWAMGGIEVLFKILEQAYKRQGISGTVIYDAPENKVHHIMEGIKADCVQLYQQIDDAGLSRMRMKRLYPVSTTAYAKGPHVEAPVRGERPPTHEQMFLEERLGKSAVTRTSMTWYSDGGFEVQVNSKDDINAALLGESGSPCQSPGISPSQAPGRAAPHEARLGASPQASPQACQPEDPSQMGLPGSFTPSEVSEEEASPSLEAAAAPPPPPPANLMAGSQLKGPPMAPPQQPRSRVHPKRRTSLSSFTSCHSAASERRDSQERLSPVRAPRRTSLHSEYTDEDGGRESLPPVPPFPRRSLLARDPDAILAWVDSLPGLVGEGVGDKLKAERLDSVPALKECNADILRMAGVPLGLALQLLTYLRKARIVLPELGRERGESVASGSTVGGSTVGP